MIVKHRQGTYYSQHSFRKAFFLQGFRTWQQKCPVIHTQKTIVWSNTDDGQLKAWLTVDVPVHPRGFYLALCTEGVGIHMLKQERDFHKLLKRKGK